MAARRWTVALHRALFDSERAEGRVVLSFTLAGGICGGGLLIGVLAALDRGSPGLHLLLAPVLFVLGTLAGMGHGLALAVVGRGAHVSRTESLRRGLKAAGLSVLLLPVGWLISSSVVVGTALRTEIRSSWLAVSLGGTVLALGVCAWAAVEARTMILVARQRSRRAREGD